MTRESNFWSALKDVFEIKYPDADIMRVENSVCPGTPDVNMCYMGQEAWIELKVAKRPKRATSIVRVDHFTDEQRLWLFNRHKAHGRAYLLLQLEDTYYRFTGDVAALLVGKCNEERLSAACAYESQSLSLMSNNIIAALRLMNI